MRTRKCTDQCSARTMEDFVEEPEAEVNLVEAARADDVGADERADAAHGREEQTRAAGAHDAQREHTLHLLHAHRVLLPADAFTRRDRREQPEHYEHMQPRVEMQLWKYAELYTGTSTCITH